MEQFRWFTGGWKGVSAQMPCVPTSGGSTP